VKFYKKNNRILVLGFKFLHWIRYTKSVVARGERIESSTRVLRSCVALFPYPFHKVKFTNRNSRNFLTAYFNAITDRATGV